MSAVSNTLVYHAVRWKRFLLIVCDNIVKEWSELYIVDQLK